LDESEFGVINEHFQWLKNKHFQINLFKPGAVGPMHIDHYPYYNDLYKIKDESKLMRIILFLQDWKNGHYFEVSDVGIVNWVAGDWVAFNFSEPHCLANIGSKNRYTLQITGTK